MKNEENKKKTRENKRGEKSKRSLNGEPPETANIFLRTLRRNREATQTKKKDVEHPIKRKRKNRKRKKKVKKKEKRKRKKKKKKTKKRKRKENGKMEITK